MRKVILIKIRAVVATGIISIFAVSGFPVLSQEADGELESTEEQSILVESTIVGDVDPAAATTVENLTIPIDQLELLVKPLTLEELQVEAAAWFLILRDKTQEISQTEIAIKRKNEAIASEEAAALAVTEAEAALEEAEAALAEATPDTPEYERATEQLEAAKQSLQDANQAVEAAIETDKELEENEALQETLEAAENEEAINTARQVLEEARRERDALAAGSAAYDVATEEIDALDQALVDLELAEEALEEAIPGSPEYQELSIAVEAARTVVIEAAEAISDEGLAPEQAAEQDSIESEAAESVLNDITADIEAAGDQVDGETEVAATEAAENPGEQLEDLAEELDAVAEVESDLKNQLVVNVTDLQGEQTLLVERLTVVLDALEQKGGDTTSYRKYIDAVSGIELDITDTEGLGVRLVSWLKSEEGGLRWGLNLAKFVSILLASAILSRLLARLSDRVLTRVGGTSTLFRDFAVIVIQRGVLVTGALLAISSLGVSLGPVLALVGGASFVLAFALQSNLGNFASGLMLLVNKPFDVGDEVRVAGYWAYVESISLASTKLQGFDGSVVTLPNNTVWGGDIINYTHSDIRKQMIYIYVKFTQDISKIYQMWMELAASHPQILDDPAPGWFPWNGHYDYHICIGLSAWCKTDVYWSVYIELLQELQKRLENMDIELAVPVQEIKFGQNATDTVVNQLSSAVVNQLPSTKP
ncbi:MAG: mechanosensitive ion channel [Symploca sp. SIO2G7]|nr:mechanosensitive ion channel [Symploca sp. SIO2G7]